MSSDSPTEHGKRTGVKISASELPKGEDGFEDVDAVFDAALSPERSSVASERIQTVKRVKARRKDVRFSLEENHVIDAGDESLAGLEDPVAAVRHFIRDARMSMSPSEISRASTAPPKPPEDEEEEEEEEANEKELGSPVAQDDADQFHVDGDLDDEADDILVTQREAHADDDDEDMIPPPPPDTSDREDSDDDVPLSELPAEDGEADDEEQLQAEAKRDATETDDAATEGSDDEGDAFAMAEQNDTFTPEQPSLKSKKKKSRDLSDSEGSDSDTFKSRKTLKEKKKKKRKKDRSEYGSLTRKKYAKVTPMGSSFPKGIPMPREYTTVPVSDLYADQDDETGLRRSKRARIRPLEYWRGERITYGPNDEFSDNPMFDSLENMPVPLAIERAEPTPYKIRQPTKPKKSDSGSSVRASGRKSGKVASLRSVDDVFGHLKQVDISKTRKKYPGMVSEGDEAFLWDEIVDDASNLKVIGYRDALPTRQLPMGANRQKSEGKVVCSAAQAFNISNNDTPFPGYLMGNLIMPPKAIKDAESVGNCAQTFTCVFGQIDAIEVAYGDPDARDGALDPSTATRFFVNVGDMFRIPPGNCYRLENHSEDAEAYLTWTIIRPSNAL